MAELLGKAYGSVPLDIAAIKQARYGRDVRAAIAEALELINGEIPVYTEWEDVKVSETEVANIDCQCRVRSGMCFINGNIAMRKAIIAGKAGKDLLWVPKSMASKHQNCVWCVAYTGGKGNYYTPRVFPCVTLTSGQLVTLSDLSADEWVGVSLAYPIE